MNHRMNEFFASHPVFTLKDFHSYLLSQGAVGERAVESMLLYYRRIGRIMNIRRGLYTTVPPGAKTSNMVPDPYLVTSRMTEDAVLVHHTALELHGKAHAIFQQYTFQTACRAAEAIFHSMRFTPVRVPAKLQSRGIPGFGTVVVDRQGLDVRTATLERTLVDVLDKPTYCGSWEEIWISLESIEFFDLEVILEYVRLLGNATLAAKVGFFLQRSRERLQVEDRYLDALRKLRPTSPRYIGKIRRGAGRLNREWNLIIDKQILDRPWEESNDIVA